MSGATSTRFRLLDEYVGWDPASVEGLTGLDGPGLRLAPVDDGGPIIDRLTPYIPPPRLAPGCGPCEHYLATPTPPAGRILVRTACEDGWQPLWAEAHGHPAPIDPVGIAASAHRLAVADAGRGRVDVWARRGAQLVASIPIEDPATVAIGPAGDVVVVTAGSSVLRFHDPSGLWRGDFDTSLIDPMVRLAFGPAPGRDPDEPCHLWIVTDGEGGTGLWQAEPDGSNAAPATVAELARSLTPTGVVAATDDGFCLRDETADGPIENCFDRYGRPLPPGAIDRPRAVELAGRGQLLTTPIDSGLPRCRWHRLRIEADVPTGTSVAVAVSSSEVAAPPAQGWARLDAGWETFAPGVPHPDDWQSIGDGATDALVQQPPGRFLFLRIRLQGDGAATPIVRRLRLDFPRASSLDALPAVYRSDPAAAEFTERFLSLFDAELDDLDRHIDRQAALLDPAGVPSSVLPWLAELAGVTFAVEWDDATRRALIAAAPDLYRTRGTVDGMRLALRLVFGVDPAVDELGPARPWGAVATDSSTPAPLDARLRHVRLFGRSQGRLRLDTSVLGRTPIKSFGNPDDDARTAGAYRVRISLPTVDGVDPAQVRDLVAAVAPAHVVPEVRFGGDGLAVGASSAVGIDTVLTPLPAPVLGRTSRLDRRTVVWPSPHGRAIGLGLDGSRAVGVSTYLE